MLRSMMIGLAIASLLQIGAGVFSPVDGMELAAQRIDWVQMQTDALSHIIANGFTLMLR